MALVYILGGRVKLSYAGVSMSVAGSPFPSIGARKRIVRCAPRKIVEAKHRKVYSSTDISVVLVQSLVGGVGTSSIDSSSLASFSRVWRSCFFLGSSCSNGRRLLSDPHKTRTQLAFFVNLHRAVIGPSATLTSRWRPDIDLRRMLTGDRVPRYVSSLPPCGLWRHLRRLYRKPCARLAIF